MQNGEHENCLMRRKKIKYTRTSQPYFRERAFTELSNQNPALILSQQDTSDVDDRNRNTQGQQASSNRIVSKRLPNGHAFSINRQADEPAIGPFEIGYDRMLQLSVTVWTDN